MIIIIGLRRLLLSRFLAVFSLSNFLSKPF